MSQYKKFKSVSDPISIVLGSGHSYCIGNELVSLPSTVWAEAYSRGAISEDVKNEDMSDYIATKKAEKEKEEADQRESYKEVLRSLYNNPVGIVDANGKLIHRKAIAALGTPVKKDVVDSIWNELVEELG